MKSRIIFVLISIISVLASASQDCAEKIKLTRYQALAAAESEKMFKSLYEEAKRDNRIATGIFIPSALVFSFVGTLPVLGVSAGNVSSFALTVGAPGLALANSIASSLHMSNVVIPMVLGWASQAVPATYALGQGVYRLFHKDKFVDMSQQKIALTIEDLKAAQEKLDVERADTYEKSNYSQLLDGILLGSLDRSLALNLYNNSVSAKLVAEAKYKLTVLSCQ